MKKIIGAGVLLAAAAIFWIYGRGSTQTQKTSIKVGISIYRQDDTFISSMMGSLESYAKTLEQEKNIKISIDISDGNENQNTQNEQVERYISLGYDVLCINMVDRAEAATVIDKAEAADIPVIFFNREPVEEDMYRWEKLYYIGSDAKEQAVLQGQMILDALASRPEEIDINQDGILQYAMLEGEIRHQDSMVRTEWSVQSLKDGGASLEKVTGGIADWERAQASAMVEQWLTDYGDQIEIIICNNDDMALGAFDAMARAGLDFHNIVGIDGTPAGIQAVDEGKMLGTVVSNLDLHAQAIMDFAYAMAMGQEIDIEKWPLIDGKYIRIPQEIYVG